jgi:(1->4)-alpha-D-glucan 1-alpha-D-glucosylmutase
MPEIWGTASRRWADLNAGLRQDGDGVTMPEPEVEWMFYQALAGAWPADLTVDDIEGVAELAERMTQFMLKAVREAKAHTSWTGHNAEYEEAIETFTRGALDPQRSGEFLQDFIATCEPAFVAGAVNSLAQSVIKLTAPGVPDIYQGSELWDLSLVDPDNRRPVDFASRQSLQTNLEDASADALIAEWRTGAIKMLVLQAGLQLRSSAKDLFDKGDHVPLAVTGAAAQHVLAFARVFGDEAVVVIVPRLNVELLRDQATLLVPQQRWADTIVDLPDNLQGHSYRNIFRGGAWATPGASLSVGEVLRHFPVGVLVSERQYF